MPAAPPPPIQGSDEHWVWLSHRSAACDQPRKGVGSGRKQVLEAEAFSA